MTTQQTIGKTKSNVTATSALAKGTVGRRPVNIRLVENVLLIWLDSNIQDNNDDCRHMVTQLRHVVNNITTFTDANKCIDFLTDMYNVNVLFIISDELCQNIVPLVHDIAQLHTFIIFCGNKKCHEQWIKGWPKIKGVFTEISHICEALKQAAQQCEQNFMPISFVATSDDVLKKNLDQLSPTFMYTQILKEILLSIEFQEQHILQFIDYCREQFAENDRQLQIINKFEEKYRDETPIWWYTCECFLYPMLNCALRLMDVDTIIKMGFFIGDLHRHIEQLHSAQFNRHHASKIFIVYRGQGLSQVDFDQMTKTKGGLISFNNFLSTSNNRNISLNFARRALTNPDLVGILFVMTIDPSKSTTPFASITDVSYYKDKEDEVLFSMHTIFRINDIQPMDENNRLLCVDLTLTSDNDKDLRALTDRIRGETRPDVEGWFRLGALLFKMGQFKKSQEVYEILLDQATNDTDKAPIYHQLACNKANQGEYKEAIKYYEKSLEIEQKNIPLNHCNLANSYNNIGTVYQTIGESSKALSYYEKARQIRQKSLPPNHPDLASSYGNIGLAYLNMGDYSKALSYYEKSLEIDEQSLPSNHPDLANSYNNIGGVYRRMGEYSKALTSYEKALKIKQKSLSPNHPSFASTYSNLGVLYQHMGDYVKALWFHEKGLEIQQKSTSPNHSELGELYNNFGIVYRKMGEYLKALKYYEKGLEIKQKLFSSDHPSLASSYGNIGNVYSDLGEYSKALSSYEKGLEIKQKTLGPNHPDLAVSYNNIGATYIKIGDYSKARSYCERAVDISQRTLPINHRDLQMWRINLNIANENL